MNPLQINHKIAIGEGDLELYHRVSIDGHVVIEQKGDSLVGNFMKLLFSFCGGIPARGDIYGHYDINNTNYHNWFTGGSITNAVSSGANTILTLSGTAWSTSEGIQVTGMIGDWEACNGFWIPVSSGPSTVTIAVNSASFGAFSTANTPYAIKKWLSATADSERSEQKTFGSPVIKLGRSIDAIGLDDQTLGDEVLNGTSPGRLEHTDNVIAVPSSDGSNVELAISTSVSNNSGGSIAIKEAGLYTWFTDYQSANDNCWVLIARDLFTTNIADGKSASVEYKITSGLNVEGGLTMQFMELLHRQISLSSTYITDINNTEDFEPNTGGAFMLAGGSGDNIQYPSYTGLSGEWVGVQIGTGNTAVTTDDYKMETRIAHGDASILTVTGSSGNLVISINAANYSEAYSASISTTIANWITSHAATLAALGTPITAIQGAGGNTIELTSNGSAITLVDNSTGTMAFTTVREIRYYGQLVENFQYDTGTGLSSFDVVRIFENVSGGDVIINETGLYAANQNSYADGAYCIARHVLAVPVTVATGEILKVTYTFTLQV